VGKGTRFPLVDERDRAPLEAVGEQLAREKPLLLDALPGGGEHQGRASGAAADVTRWPQRTKNVM
jgi:hypothetical protein